MIVASPTEPEIEVPIVTGEFWPDIDPAEIRDEQRIDNTVTPDRLRAAIIEATVTTIESLAAWKAAQIAAGYASLEAVPTAEQIDDESPNLHRFRRAVGCLAKALLLERYRDFDTTAKGDRNADQLTDPIGDHRRDHHHAIAGIIGRGRVTIELI